MIGAALVISALVCVWLYVRLRPRGHPVHDVRMLASRAEAERRAAEATKELVGCDVSRWRVFSALVRDDEALDTVSSVGRSHALDALLRRWGVEAEWRVQFVSRNGAPEQTVLVGLNDTNGVTLLDANLRDVFAPPGSVDGDRRRTTDAVDLLSDHGSHWRQVRTIGRGTISPGEGSTERIEHVTDTAGPVTVHATVTAVGGNLRQVDRRLELDEDRAGGSRASLAWQDLIGTGAVLTSVGGLVVGLVVLVTTDAPADLPLATLLAIAAASLNMASDGLSLPSAVVGVYDGRVPLRTFQLVTGCTMATMSVLYGVIVFVAAGAGTALASLTGITIAEDPLRQTLIGLGAAAAWLAFSTSFYTLLARRGSCTQSTSPSGSFVALSGQPWTRSTLAAGVSALSEETVFRLLAISLVLAVTDSVVLAVAVSAVAWALVHSGQVTDPPWFRLIELGVVGLALGVLFLQFGLLAVLVAHAGFNTVVLRSHTPTVIGQHS